MHKNKNLFAVLFLLVFSVGTLLSISGAEAATGLQYELLEKIPGLASIDGSDLPGYIKAIYNLALVIVTLSAILMLSVGGFMYLTSAGNTSAMSTAKGVIFDALIGLAITLTAWLVLNVINPDLRNVTINGLSPVPVTGGTAPVGPSIPPPPPSQPLQIAAGMILEHENISSAGSGDCSTTSETVSPRSNMRDVAEGRAMDQCFHGCNASSGPCAENAVNPSVIMLNAVLAAGQGHSFTITSMSGGSHGTTSSHYKGMGMDIVPPSGSDWQSVLSAFIASGALSSSFCEAPNGHRVGCNGGGADHIHLNFP